MMNMKIIFVSLILFVFEDLDGNFMCILYSVCNLNRTLLVFSLQVYVKFKQNLRLMHGVNDIHFSSS